MVCDHAMQYFVSLQLMVGAVIVAIALLHLILAWHDVRPKLNLVFALLSFCAAGEALSAPVRYLSTTIPGAILGIRFGQGFVIAFGVALAWFAREYGRLQDRMIPLVLTGLGAVALALHVLLPYSLRYREVTGLRASQLPGGGVMYTPVGIIHPWLGLANVFGALCILYVIAVCIKLWRDPAARRGAVAFTLGMAPIVLFAYPQGVMVSRQLIDPPQYYAFAYLGLVCVVSYNLVGDAARSIALSREVRSNERRWKSLLDTVSLFVVGFDRSGLIEYVNPYLSTVLGYPADQLLGKRFDVLYPPSELPSQNQVFDEAMSGKHLARLEATVLTRSKQERTVLWSIVLLRGPDDSITGTLNVGIDLTERVMAEKARDEAMAQLAAFKAELEAENQYLRLEFEASVDSADFVGKSDGIRYVLHKVAQVAGTTATVLIEGETGVGKELVARAIHKASARANMPFIRVNCAALPPSLIESELFGHERGSFTGADRAHQGRFELAEGGTILLDEIGEVTLDIQAKLLRVLQEGEFDRVGGTKTRKADVRVIASTNRDLRDDVALGRFREDLYYRLQVFPISVPPLRERRDDIPLLVHYFVQRLCLKHRKPVMDVPMKAIHQMSERDWPGNVRELENLIERAVITSTGPVLVLPNDLGRNGHGISPEPSRDLLTLDAVERHHIEEVLKRTGGQIAGDGGAAQILGLHPNTLRGRMAKLGVERPKS